MKFDSPCPFKTQSGRHHITNVARTLPSTGYTKHKQMRTVDVESGRRTNRERGHAELSLKQRKWKNSLTTMQENDALKIFEIKKGKNQYLGLVEGIATGRSCQKRKDYLMDVTVDLATQELNLLPSEGRSIELLPVALATGAWFVKIFDSHENRIPESPFHLSLTSTHRRTWMGKTIQLRNSRFDISCTGSKGITSDIESTTDFIEASHTSCIFPSRNHVVSLGQYSKAFSPKETRNTVDFVGCISLIAFDGFESHSESKEMNNVLVGAVLEATKNALVSQVQHNSLERNFDLIPEPLSSLVCVLEGLEIEPLHNENRHIDALKVTGGFSAVIDADIGSTENNDIDQNNMTFCVNVTTCEVSRRIVGIDGE
jgi:hypothetical protein